MSKRRLLGRGKVNYYHLMSQVVGQQFLFGKEEKAVFPMANASIGKVHGGEGIDVLHYVEPLSYFAGGS